MVFGGKIVEEIVDWHDTINPTHKASTMPPLWDVETERRRRPEPQDTSEREGSSKEIWGFLRSPLGGPRKAFVMLFILMFALMALAYGRQL